MKAPVERSPALPIGPGEVAAIAGTSGSPDVDWALGVMYGPVPGATVHTGPAPAGTMTLASFTALPAGSRPRLLVPSSDGRSAASALRQYNQGMSRTARSRKLGAAALVGLGAARLGRNRVSVSAPPGLDDRSLAGVIASDLGVSEVRLSAFIGAPRPNRKPVLQVTSPSGRVLGYAKVAWNDLTDDLVANEAAALRTLNRRPMPGLVVPAIRSESVWNGRRVLVTSGGAHRLRRRGRIALRPDASVLAAVGGIDAAGPVALSELPFVGDIRRRIACLSGVVRERAASAIRRIVEEFGDRAVLAGRWHGDWSPWNMQRTRHGWFVWDWERSAPGVPVGMDAVHHAFQWSYHLTGGDADAAAVAARWEAGARLPELGQPARMERAFVGLSLLELLLRFEEGRQAGIRVEDAPAARLAAVLARWVEAR